MNCEYQNAWCNYRKKLWFSVSVHVHILVSWPDDDPRLGLKLVAI